MSKITLIFEDIENVEIGQDQISVACDIEFSDKEKFELPRSSFLLMAVSGFVHDMIKDKSHDVYQIARLAHDRHLKQQIQTKH